MDNLAHALLQREDMAWLGLLSLKPLSASDTLAWLASCLWTVRSYLASTFLVSPSALHWLWWTQTHPSSFPLPAYFPLTSLFSLLAVIQNLRCPPKALVSKVWSPRLLLLLGSLERDPEKGGSFLPVSAAQLSQGSSFGLLLCHSPEGMGQAVTDHTDVNIFRELSLWWEPNPFVLNKNRRYYIHILSWTWRVLSQFLWIKSISLFL